MKKTNSTTTEEGVSTEPSVSFKRKRGFRIMGLNMNADGAVKGFFGGNAYLAILALLFICVFLFKSAMGFVPGYKTELTEARISGVEVSNHLQYELTGYDVLYSKINQAFINERRVRFEELETLVPVYEEYEAVIDAELESDIEDYLELDDGAEKDAATELLKQKIAKACASISKDEMLKRIKNRLPETSKISDKTYQQALSYALQYAFDDSTTPEEITKIPNEINAQMGEFFNAMSEIESADDELRELFEKIEKQTQFTYQTLRTNRKSKESLETLTKAFEKGQKEKPKKEEKPTKQRLEEAKEALKDPELKGAALTKAQQVLKQVQQDIRENKLTWAEKQAERSASIETSKKNIKAVDTEERIKPVYDLLAKHQPAAESMISGFEKGFTMLDKVKVTQKHSQELLADSKKLFGELKEIVAERKEEITEWKHDKSVSIWTSLKAFFFGTTWKTGSDRQGLYGLIPLLTGSLLISFVAMFFAIPLAVGAAIYVNQFAHKKEAGLLKPAIEFIQAIPSVVLGLFGVLVVAGLLQSLSNWDALSWIPGFPIKERLNIFLAGILLAFMASPTIFTLAEDALNNVPKAYREASLAMGATKLQTTLKIIVPASLSGIIAAVMLGFGRVIGETMVVLLVAGNKIKIPDFSQGVGVLGEPVHTMTGIIAQEYGEIEPGTLHWEALFMVGLILFLISLTINTVCQRMLNRRAK